MACTSVINSATVGLSLDGVVVAWSNDVTLTVTHESREISNKDSGGWRDFAEGMRGWTASVAAWYVAAGAGGAAVVFAKIKTRATFDVQVLAINATETDAIGGFPEILVGKAWPENLTYNSPGTQENVSFNASLKGCGKLDNDGAV